MSDTETVMMLLEALAQDDWVLHFNDNEVKKTAKAALALLKDQESEENRILKIVWTVLHSTVSVDTEADQDYVYELIRNQVRPMY